MNLTTEQQRVLDHLEGHLLVLAGPGSGKTHTLIEKVFYIFDQQIIPEPYGLLAITFSNAAVTEIHKRLWDKSFRRWDRISVRTFHSFAMHLLRCYGKDVGVREDFGVIDRDERLRLLDKLLLKHTSNMRRSDFDSWIQRLKRQGIYPECNERFAQPGERRFQAAYGDFQDNLFSKNKLDFDDLIYFAIKLVRESALVNGLFTRYFRYVIVDEFQDTDQQQLQLVELFAASAVGSTVFADDDQAIYGFRGGNKRNVQTIANNLQSEIIELPENFRSPTIVLEAAQHIIARDEDRIHKTPSAKSDENGALLFFGFSSDRIEAEAVTRRISALQDKDLVDDLGDIAVVTRNRKRAEWIIDALDKACIPWFDRSRLPFDYTWDAEIALSILLAYCRISSSDSLYSLMAVIENSGISFYYPHTDALETACNIRDRLQNLISQKGLRENVSEILDASGFPEILETVSANSSDIERFTNNIDDLASFIEEEARNREYDLQATIRLISGRNAVQLITSHGAKGREFGLVYFVGVEDDVIPGWGNLSDDRISEERRVFYVTLTRTRKVLHISYARNVRGHSNKKPSRFINDIPHECFSEFSD